MLIHCLIKREGPTTVTLENTKYLFMPILGSKKGEMTTSVCDIGTERHADHLLKLSMYEVYDQEKIDAERVAATPDVMTGFAIEKYFDKGYVAVDKRKKPVKHAGETGEWVEKSVVISNPFKSEIEAFTFLKDETQSAELDEKNESDDVTAMVNKLTPKKKNKG